MCKHKFLVGTAFTMCCVHHVQYAHIGTIPGPKSGLTYICHQITNKLYIHRTCFTNEFNVPQHFSFVNFTLFHLLCSEAILLVIYYIMDIQITTTYYQYATPKQKIGS